MKKLTTLATILFCVIGAPVAQSEGIPPGCYITDSERNLFGQTFGYVPRCFVASDNYYNWFTHNQYGRTEMSVFYGPAVEAILYADYQDLNACMGAHNSLLADHQALTGNYNAATANLNAATADNKARITLEKKLRKACGSKCKRIK
jgi:hypothetical protein